MPRHPDPELEQRILTAASRLWSRGGEKALTMRAVAKAAGTTTPTVYERYNDREDILRALRLKTRRELYAVLIPTRTLPEAIHSYLRFALDNSHGYEVLFDGVGRPPSLYEPWPSFNLMRNRLAQQLRGRFRGTTACRRVRKQGQHGRIPRARRSAFRPRGRHNEVRDRANERTSARRLQDRPGRSRRRQLVW